jgi:hypothetical protein
MRTFCYQCLRDGVSLAREAARDEGCLARERRHCRRPCGERIARPEWWLLYIGVVTRVIE